MEELSEAARDISPLEIVLGCLMFMWVGTECVVYFKDAVMGVTTWWERWRLAGALMALSWGMQHSLGFTVILLVVHEGVFSIVFLVEEFARWMGTTGVMKMARAHFGGKKNK